MIEARWKRVWDWSNRAPNERINRLVWLGISGFASGMFMSAAALVASAQQIQADAADRAAQSHEEELEIIKESARLATIAAMTADRQARRLVIATYVLAAATIGLFISTVVLVFVTATHHGA